MPVPTTLKPPLVNVFSEPKLRSRSEFALPATTEPVTSVTVVAASPRLPIPEPSPSSAVLPVRVDRSTATRPLAFSNPPPRVAELPESVLRVIVTESVPSRSVFEWMPPPLPPASARLPEIVVEVTSSVPPTLKIPPPGPKATFPDTVLEVSVSVPVL